MNDVLRQIFVYFGIIWYTFIVVLSFSGWLCLRKVYNQSPRLGRDRHPLQESHAGGEGSDTESTGLNFSTTIGVSILRPMLGIDPDSYECLKSSFIQAYPSKDFEILLSVKSPSDPIIQIAERVISEHPHVNARLIIGDVDVGVNPKINNLIKSYTQARFPIIWILDSNCWISSHTLKNAAEYFKDEKVNLVHHIPVAHAGAGLGAKLDDIYMSTMHAKMYAIINYLNIAPCVMGKSNLLRKSEISDFQNFGRYIAEDHLLATSVWRGRGSHVLAQEVVRQPLVGIGWSQYWHRRVRWIRVRKYMTIAATLVEPFTECFMSGLIGALVCPFRGWLYWSIHVLTWFIMDNFSWQNLRRFPDGEVPPFNGTMNLSTWVLVWLIRESTAPFLWLIAMSRDRLHWRGSWFVINLDMTARRLDGTSS